MHMQLRQACLPGMEGICNPPFPCRAVLCASMQVMLCTCECVCTRWGMMETPGVVGTSSVMDSGVWQEALQRHPPPLTIRPPSIMESGATCRVPAYCMFLHIWSAGSGHCWGVITSCISPGCWLSASSICVGRVARASGVLFDDFGENHTHVLMSAAWHSCILPCHQFGMCSQLLSKQGLATDVSC